MTDGDAPHGCDHSCHPHAETINERAQLSSQLNESMKLGRLPDVVASSRPKTDRLAILRLTLVGTQLRLISKQFDASRTPAG